MSRQQATISGLTLTVHPASPHQALVDGAQFTVEDWWINVSGLSWHLSGSWAARNYRGRVETDGITPDNEVLYGHIDGMGYLVHTSEIEV